MYQSADQYDVTCSCGQWDERVVRRQDAAKAHDDHKRAVLSGAHAAARAAEAERRLAAYDEVLARIDSGEERNLTREQVEGWQAEVRSGKFKS